MKRLKHWLKKGRAQKPEAGYICSITGEVEVTRREFLMEQLEERIVLDAPTGDPMQILGEEWYYGKGYVGTTDDGIVYKASGEYNEIIFGTRGADIIDCSGSEYRHIIIGKEGADTIIGGDGDDYIIGWIVSYYDSIENDFDEAMQYYYNEMLERHGDGLSNSSDKELLIGGGGTDYIWGGPGDDIIYGDSPGGEDSFRDHIYGNEGDDLIYGDRESGTGTAPDVIDGGPGDDTIYGDVLSGTGTGGDEISGNDGNDTIFGDTRSGTGSGRDEIWGGDGDDLLYGDSYYGDGYGRDEISGGPGDDTVYGDSVFGNGYADDEIQGNDGNDTLSGDSSRGSGFGNDVIRGDAGTDRLYGDSERGPGFGDDRLSGGDGNDRLYGDSHEGEGSGSDVIHGGDGLDRISGDGLAGDVPGFDTLYTDAGDTVIGQGRDGDVVVERVEGPNGISYDISGGDPDEYRIDDETGKLMVYNHVFARWDPLGERFWDEEQQAYVQTTGVSVDVQHATKRLRYENGGTQVWIQRNGAWEEYDPDAEYIIDMQEDWETGALLVYNNDFERYEPYGEPFQPDGADYTLINEFDMVYLMYDDGTTICLENFGDGAMLSTEATGYGFMEMRGEKSYYDSSNGFWWSYGWDGWSFSIDGGSTWKETPSLEIQVVEDGALDDYVGVFDGKEWSQVKGRLEFLDEDYAMVGWLGMDQFFYDLYDGVGYDGEPLRLTYREYYDSGGDEQSDRWDHLPSSGHETDDTSVPVGELTDVILKVYGEFTDKCLASFIIPNPCTAPLDTAWYAEHGMSVVFHSSRVADGYVPRSFFVNEIIDPNASVFDPHPDIVREQAIGENVLYRYFEHSEYSLEKMVGELEALQQCFNTESREELKIENIAILRHGNYADDVGHFKIGTTHVDWYNLCSPYVPVAEHYYYTKWFERLDTVMQDGGQIQHYGCNVAGGNPFHENARDLHLDYNPFSWEFQSYNARCMLATIAHLTNTNVFASSDGQSLGFDPDEQRPTGGEFCLEFGVNPDGIQLDYTLCSQEPWNLEAWTPKGAVNNIESIQLAFDNQVQWYQGVGMTQVDTKGTDEKPGMKYKIYS